MAKQRMFATVVTESDDFLELPIGAQALYFHANLSADDEGFVTGLKSMARLIGASEGDIQALMQGGWFDTFPNSKVLHVYHWNTHNHQDKGTSTSFFEEKKQLPPERRTYLNDKNAVEQRKILDAYDAQKARGVDMETGEIFQNFNPPTMDEVAEYFRRCNIGYDAITFHREMQAAGWPDGEGWKHRALDL